MQDCDRIIASEQFVRKAPMFLSPEAATSAMDFLVTWAMKPTMEKMTKPANMLVHELMKHTMMESLGRVNVKHVSCQRFK